VAYYERQNEMGIMISQFIEANPERMSGAPCFKGTRVPATHLFDYLEAGDSLGDFLNDFPTVTREQVLGVLELMRKRLLTEYETAA
jgi:uncharacterized protein (DUF433 family)